MKVHKLVLAAVLTTSSACVGTLASAAERWQEATFPAPNGGHLVFAITADGNPGCASYDGASCLWGTKMADIDFSKVRPLVCGAQHRRLYGVTGFEDPKHWCNLALADRATQRPPAASPPSPPTPPPATPPVKPATPSPAPSGYRLTDWSPWARMAGLDYRYRVRWDPASGGPGKTVEAVYDLRNRGTQRWSGAARSVDCAKDTLWGSTDVELGPGQAREVRVRAPNCGSASHPDIRPNVVRAGKFD
jgi:hypothetical protein